jgi:hypothetical protein
MDVKTEVVQRTRTVEFKYFRRELERPLSRKRYFSGILLSIFQISFIILVAVYANYDTKKYDANGTSYSSNYF